MLTAITLALCSPALYPSAPCSSGAPQDDPPPSETVGSLEQTVLDIGVTPDGKTLVVMSEKGGVEAWNLKKAESIWKADLFKAPSGAGGAALGSLLKPTAFDVSEQRVVYHLGHAAASWLDIETGEADVGIGGTTAMQESKCLCTDPKGKWIWIGTERGLVTRVVPGSIDSWSNRALDNGGVTCLDMDPKGKTLAAGGEKGTVRFVGAKSANVDDKKIVQAFESPVLAVAIDPKAGSVAAGAKDGALGVWKIANQKRAAELEGHEADLTRLAWHPKGKLLAAGDGDGRLIVWDASKGERKLTLELTGGVCGLVWLDKGKSLATASKGDDVVTVWDLSDVK